MFNFSSHLTIPVIHLIPSGPILRWIEAFLTDRVQGVVVEGV